MLRRFNLFNNTTSSVSCVTAAATTSKILDFVQYQSSSAAASTSASTPPTASSGLRKVRVKSTTRAPQTLADLQRRISKEMNDLNKGCGTSAEPVEKKPLSALQKRQLAMKDKLVFSLGPNAIYRIKLLMESYNKQAEASGKPKAVGIRVGVQKRGCSGLSYTVNYALEPEIQKYFERKEEFYLCLSEMR